MIRKPVKASTSLHGDNTSQTKMTKPEQELLNHYTSDRLTDPEDDSSGSTHGDNEGKLKVRTASVADDFEEGTDVEATTNVNTPQNEGEDDTLLNNDGSANGVVAAGTEDLSEEELDFDWDAPLPGDDAEVDLDGEEPVEEEVEETDEPVEVEGGEEMPILDVDNTDDTSCDMAFASLGTKLMVIRANRIIATMTKRVATAGNREDVYLSDQFQEVTASEVAKQGLRKGLTSMGFVLATVNVGSNEVLNKRVAAKASVQASTIRKVQKDNTDAFNQSLAIAAVGINRRFFKDVDNTLAASLEQSLTQAGVRGGSRLVSQAFSEHGPAYAKMIVSLANKLSAMPQELRDTYVAALDMTSEDAGEENLYEEGGVDGEDFGEDFADAPDFVETASVTASLSNPGHKVKSLPKGSLSVQAHSILNGDAPLFTL